MKPLRRASHFAKLLLLLAIYVAAGKLGLSLAREHPSASAVWPPTGIAIAALLLLGWQMWPAIFIGAFLVNITTAGNAATSLGIAFGNTLEALAAALLLNRFAHGRHAFDRVRDVFTFILLAAMASTTLSATIGVASLALGGFADGQRAAGMWTTWWLGDAVGAAVVTPFILAWSRSSPLRWDTRRAFSAVTLLLILVVVSDAIFGGIFPSASRSFTLPFLAIPILVWIALRFGHREAATAMFLMSVIAVSSVVHGVGPFVRGTPHSSLLSLQAFLGVVSAIAMLVAAEISERRSAEQRLDAQQAIARILGEASTVPQAMPLILQAICEKLRWDVGAFWSVDSDSEFTRCGHIWASPQVAIVAAGFISDTQNRCFPRGSGLPGRAWQSGHIAWIDDVVADPNFPRAAQASAAGLRAAFGFPVVLRERVFAILEFFSRGPRRADAELLSMLETVGSQIGLFIERTEAAAELIHRKSEAESANKAKDNFLAVLSHELRTPLTPIISAIDELAPAFAPDAPQHETLATIRRNVDLEARLIDDLLDVTRLGCGKMELRKCPVDVHQCVRDAQMCCRSEIESRGVTVDLRLAASNPWVNADPVRLQQIFWNLLRNAIKFSPAGTAIVVASGNSADQGELHLEIIDRGVGIAPELLPHIFEPFVQAETAFRRRFGGLGLGLAISRTLTEMHGGTLVATSDGVGSGATFSLRFATIESLAEPLSPAPTSTTSNGTARALRILLVDDHLDTRAGLERLLRRRGHEVHCAADIATALSLAAADKFDFLISDLGLPDGNGCELVQRLRAREPLLKAIAISGFGMEDDRERSKASGFSEHLLKPFEFARLEAAIEQLSG